MPRKKKEHVIKVEGDIVKTHRGLFQVRPLIARGGRVIATFSPLRLKFEPRDAAQIFIGSIILASPFMVTEEVWNLGQQMPVFNSVLLMVLTLLTLSILLFYTRYEKVTFEGRLVVRELTKRLIITYLIAFLTVSMLLTILGKAPWNVDVQLAIKRVILIALPASLGGAAVDLLK